MARDVARAERGLPSGTWVVADLHLDPAGGADVERFGTWIDRLEGVPALVVLGDLFDVWVGPAQARLAGAARALEALARLTARGTALALVPGNRDFLLGDDFERACGGEVHARGFVGRLPGTGQRVLLLHGDELCTRDRGYQRLKRVLRSAPVRWLAPRLPLAVARRAARGLRGASERAVPRKPDPEKALQPEAVRALAAAERAATLVCGHAHRFRDEVLPDGPRWLVLDAFGGPRDALRVGPAGELVSQASGGGPVTGPGSEALSGAGR